MKKYNFLFLILFVCLCCNTNHKKADNCLNSTIDSIYVSYYNYDSHALSEAAITFEYLKNAAHRPTFKNKYEERTHQYFYDYKGVIDIVITDCNVFSGIENEMKRSVRNDMFNRLLLHNVRMSAVIVYNNEKRDTLLFEFDSPFIYICGNEGYWDEDFGLAYLLRKNTGFYSWFSIHEKESFMELDTLDRINTIEMWSENNPLLDCIQ